jgi:hypothetical protein
MTQTVEADDEPPARTRLSDLAAMLGYDDTSNEQDEEGDN